MKHSNIQTEEMLLNKIKIQFPELRWKTFRTIHEGWDHDVVILDQKFVFRFPKKADSRKQFAAEMELMDQIPKMRLQIPRYEFKAKDGSFGGYKLIQGTELTAKLYRSLSVSTKAIVTKQIAEFLTQLHGTPLSSLELFGLKESKSVQSTRRLQTRLMKRLSTCLSKKQIATVDRFFSLLVSEQ